MRKLYVIIIFVLGVNGILYAQNKCELALTRATEEFNAGHFFAIPGMLKECIDENPNREWRQRAYLLLAQTYLLLEDPLGAENSYLEVLRANPEYTTSDLRDPIDLVYLGSKFTSTPVFSIFAKVGPNVSFVQTILMREAFGENISEQYIPRVGFQIGGGFDWNFDDRFALTIEGNYVSSSYKLQRENIFGDDKLVMKDRQGWVRLPVSVKYSYDKGKYRPFIYGGISFDALIKDEASFEYTDGSRISSTGDLQSEFKESPRINMLHKRNMFNYSWFLGAGVKYKLGLQYAFIDVRYIHGMTNVVNVDYNLYDYELSERTTSDFQNSASPLMNWGHVDDLFRMDNLQISIGYIHPLYKPRKLKKAKSRSVLKSIKKI
jgi:opacity protein-like surface antigen